jgi:hypothetical protein
MTYVNIPDTTLLRDVNSRALIETDKTKKEEYKARSAQLTAQKKQQEDINNLKSDMEEIKNLLKGLINQNVTS